MTAGNNIDIVGNLTRDPELRFTPSGQATTSFGVAVNRRWQNRQTQEWEEAVSFFDVVCWGGLAENAAQSLTKGARVVVAGRLEQRSWETDGEKRSKVEIVADEVAPSLRFATAALTKVERSDRPAAAGTRAALGAPRRRRALLVSEQRRAEPGELCTCGRPAREVYTVVRDADERDRLTDRLSFSVPAVDVTGACCINDGGRGGPWPCVFCDGAETHERGERCPRYHLSVEVGL